EGHLSLVSTAHIANLLLQYCGPAPHGSKMANPRGFAAGGPFGPAPPPEPGVVTGIPPTAAGPCLRLPEAVTGVPPFPPPLSLNSGFLTLITASTPLAMA